jgi:hypothetical protein
MALRRREGAVAGRPDILSGAARGHAFAGWTDIVLPEDYIGSADPSRSSPSPVLR